MSSQRRLFVDIHDLLINDEVLLRLLYYPPADYITQPDPLSDELDNILDMDLDELWDIRDKHILLSSKDDDLVDNELCRVYLYPGKIRPSYQNSATIKQEVVLDIFCHFSFVEADQRMMMITDRLNELMLTRKIRGLSEIGYLNGYDFVAPKGYQSYRHIFETTRLKRDYSRRAR